MNTKERKIADFVLNVSKGAYIEGAIRYTIDSILGKHLRILIASLRSPVDKKLGINGLVPFDVWSDEKEIVLERKEAAKTIGVKPSQLVERRVFVRISDKTFDITKSVREESKKVYKLLLSREIISSKATSEVKG